MGELRVLFLTLYPESAASPRYRVWQFLPYLRRNHVACTVRSPLDAAEWAALTGPARQHRPFWYHVRETWVRFRQILEARRYDLVFVQKALMTAYVKGLPELLRRRSRRLVYDIDDAVHLAPPHPLSRPWNLIEDRGQVQRIIGQCDLVLAGNAWLAQTAREWNLKTVLFPTVVDTDRFAPAGRAPARFRIGWIGSSSTTVCLAPAVDALRAVRDAEIHLVGADPGRVDLPSATFRPWRLDTEVDEVRNFSIGIMPQPDEEWMRGKCSLKALQYLSCGIPCVASPVGNAPEVVRHMETGILAQSTADWFEAFDRLREPGLRARLGAAGRAVVEEKFSLRQAGPRLLELLREVA